MHPDPDPVLLRNSGSARNRTRTSGSAATNSDHWTTEAVMVYTVLPVNGYRISLNFDVKNNPKIYPLSCFPFALIRTEVCNILGLPIVILTWRGRW
jgi:hypothetical protein